MARKPKSPAPAEMLSFVEVQIERGQIASAIEALLPALDRRAEDGDGACALAARVLRLTPMAEAALPRAPDALAATLDRLLQLTGRQEEQIHALRAMIEDDL